MSLGYGEGRRLSGDLQEVGSINLRPSLLCLPLAQVPQEGRVEVPLPLQGTLRVWLCRPSTHTLRTYQGKGKGNTPNMFRTHNGLANQEMVFLHDIKKINFISQLT